MGDLLFRLRYWVLRKLNAVDRTHYETLVDGYIEMTQRLNKECGESRRQVEAMQSAYHDLNPNNAPFYSWQRDYQDLCRHVLMLGDDASVETIATALLLRDQQEPTP